MAKIIGLFTFCLLLPVFAATAPAQIACSFSDARDTASTRGFAGQCDECARDEELNFDFENESEGETERERIETERHDFTQSTTVVGRLSLIHISEPTRPY